MSFIEFIVFIVSMILFVFLSQKQMREKRRYIESEGDFDDEDSQQQAIREMMISLNMSQEEAEVYEAELAYSQNRPPVPPKSSVIKRVPVKPKTTRTLSDQYKLEAKLEKQHMNSKLEKRKLDRAIDHRYEGVYRPIVSEGLRVDPNHNPYAIKAEQKESRAARLIRNGGSKKNMILLRAILGKPKALS